MVIIKEKNNNKIKEVKIKEGIKKVRDVLIEAGYNPEEYLVSKDGKIIPDDEEVNDKDTLQVIKIVSGG